MPLTASDSPRITSIDALRGFTLLGIIITHMVEQYYAGPPPEKYAAQTTATIIDMIASGFTYVFIVGKFYAIFSFLFGLSFFIQLSKAETNFSFTMKFLWRLITLFAIGLIHHIHYRGDILTIYALLGVVLLVSSRMSDKYLLILSLVLIFDVPGILMRVIGTVFSVSFITDFMKQDQTKLIAAYDAIKSGSYFELLKVNLESFSLKILFQIWSGRIFMTPGLFLLGLYAGRVGVFREVEKHIGSLKKCRRIAAWGVFLALCSAILFFVLGNTLTGGLSNETAFLAGISFFNIFNTFLATVIVISFLMLYQQHKWQKRLMHFYAVGRMGLTTYLTQSAIGVFIFSTLGLQLLGELGAATCFAFAIMIFIVQIWISKQWLKHFYYGPVEWLWRSLTHLKVQPLIKSNVRQQTIAVE